MVRARDPLTKSFARQCHHRRFVWETFGLELRVDQVSIKRKFEAAPGTRLKSQFRNLLFVGLQNFARQTESFGLIVSHRAVLQMYLHQKNSLVDSISLKTKTCKNPPTAIPTDTEQTNARQVAYRFFLAFLLAVFFLAAFFFVAFFLAVFFLAAFFFVAFFLVVFFLTTFFFTPLFLLDAFFLAAFFFPAFFLVAGFFLATLLFSRFLFGSFALCSLLLFLYFGTAR